MVASTRISCCWSHRERGLDSKQSRQWNAQGKRADEIPVEQGQYGKHAVSGRRSEWKDERRVGHRDRANRRDDGVVDQEKRYYRNRVRLKLLEG